SGGGGSGCGSGSRTGEGSTGGSSIGGTGDGSSTSPGPPATGPRPPAPGICSGRIISGKLPSINSGCSERPQPRERSPPKPVSANRRKAAFTGSAPRGGGGPPRAQG